MSGICSKHVGHDWSCHLCVAMPVNPMAINDLHRELTVFNIGPDEEYPPMDWDGQYDWAVVWYEVDGYEGNGESVLKRSSDGKLVQICLSHCSCCNGWDDGFAGSVGIDDIASVIDESVVRNSATCGLMTPVAAKVIELLDQEKRSRDSGLRAEGDGGEVCERPGLQVHDDPQAPQAHPGT